MESRQKRKFSRTEASLFLIPLLLLVLFGGWWFEEIRWAANPNAEPFEKKVRSLAGFNALDCGHQQIAPGALDIATNACAVSSFQRRRPFRVIYSSKDSDGQIMNVALVGKPNGKVYLILKDYLTPVIKVYECFNARVISTNKYKEIIWSDEIPLIDKWIPNNNTTVVVTQTKAPPQLEPAPAVQAKQ